MLWVCEKCGVVISDSDGTARVEQRKWKAGACGDGSHHWSHAATPRSAVAIQAMNAYKGIAGQLERAA